MMTFTDAEQRKTLAEYLGITGTADEIQKKLEDSDRAGEVLSGIFDTHGRWDIRDSVRKPYPFVIAQVSSLTIGQMISDNDQLTNRLAEEYKEIRSDYDESYGAKPKRFFASVGFEESKDGYDRDFFFRYWRSPLTKILTARGIDTTNSAGQDAAMKVLKELFGNDAVGYRLEDLISETPEHLIEQHDRIEADRKRTLNNEQTEMQVLRDRPFYETLVKGGINFTDISNAEQTAGEAFAQPEAHRILNLILSTTENMDLDVFKTTINMTPRTIEFQAANINRDLRLRNDDRYLADHPTATFGEFMSARYARSPDGISSPAEAALKAVLKTDKPLDMRAVQEAKEALCQDLQANRDKILKGVTSRRRRQMTLLGGTIGSLVVAGALAVTSLYNNVAQRFSSTEKRMDRVTQTAPAQKPAQEVEQKAEQTAEKPAEKNTMAEKLSQASQPISTTNRVETAEKPAETVAQAKQETTNTATNVPAVKLTEKGNRPILLEWKGFSDIRCSKPDPAAGKKLFTGEYWDIFNQIKKNGRPYGEILDADAISRSVTPQNNALYPTPAPGEAETKFYIRRLPSTWKDGVPDRDRVIQDLLSYHMNVRDVLDSLPFPKEDLPKAQMLALHAFGPSIGWSVAQQAEWQMGHGTAAKDAQETIFQNAQKIIKDRNYPADQLKTVFAATMEATAQYRETHPENQALLLSAEGAIRQSLNLTMEDVRKYQNQSDKDLADVRPYVEKTSVKDYSRKTETSRTASSGSYTGSQRPSPRREKPAEKGYPWGWIAITAAATCWLMNKYYERKNRIVK
ncbi:MAG: hypothetical protein IJV07_00475 [Alphaproteobacteria bacterium]|nr:hypothetical protein [Alphaproteobacteria bacterium]